MRQKIIKILKISGIFIGGIIIGAVLMNLFHMYVRSTYRETIRIDLKTEQEFLASRAARQGDKVRTVSHRWNVVDAEAEDGFRAFQKIRNQDIDSSFLFPFYMCVLKWMSSGIEGQQKGRKISEGIDRGRLALALEAIGASQEAARQWKIARAMITKKRSIEDTRRLILKLREQENSDIYLQAERAILDQDEVQQKNPVDAK